MAHRLLQPGRRRSAGGCRPGSRERGGPRSRAQAGASARLGTADCPALSRGRSPWSPSPRRLGASRGHSGQARRAGGRCTARPTPRRPTPVILVGGVRVVVPPGGVGPPNPVGYPGLSRARLPVSPRWPRAVRCPLAVPFVVRRSLLSSCQRPSHVGRETFADLVGHLSSRPHRPVPPPRPGRIVARRHGPEDRIAAWPGYGWGRPLARRLVRRDGWPTPRSPAPPRGPVRTRLV
jgi:hypothetical protein